VTRRATGIGSGLIAMTLGIAVESSGLRGTAVEIAAWCAVGLGVVLLVATGIVAMMARVGTDAARPPSGDEATEVCCELERLGSEILQFIDRRAAEAPATGPDAEAPVWHPLRVSRERRTHSRAMRHYDEDTMSLFHGSFGSDLRTVVGELLQRGRIGRNEARTLVTARAVPELEPLGLRLLELGNANRRESRRAQPA
jgi:hypothetical protein